MNISDAMDLNLTQYEILINESLLAFDIEELAQNLTSLQMVNLTFASMH